MAPIAGLKIKGLLCIENVKALVASSSNVLKIKGQPCQRNFFKGDRGHATDTEDSDSSVQQLIHKLNGIR